MSVAAATTFHLSGFQFFYNYWNRMLVTKIFRSFTPIKFLNGCLPLKTRLRIKCVPETLNRSSPSYSWIVFVELPLYLFLLQIFKNVYLFTSIKLPCFDCITWLYTESAWQHIHHVFLLFPTPDFGFLIEQHVKTRNYPSGSIKKHQKIENIWP